MTEPRTDDEIRGYHDWGGDRTVAVSVVRAVAAALDLAPSQIDPLSDAIDTEALEALFSHRVDGTSRGGGSVSLSFEGCRVTVHADGEIVVRPPE